MHSFGISPRRSFLQRLAGAAAAVGVGSAFPRALTAQGSAQPTTPWLDKLTGSHRCLFDFPNHGRWVPLLHMSTTDTYTSAYGTKPGEVNATVTLLSRPGLENSLAFNDGMWQKYKREPISDGGSQTRRLGAKHVRRDVGATGLLGRCLRCRVDVEPPKMGGSFLLCNNALGMWSGSWLSSRAAPPMR